MADIRLRIELLDTDPLVWRRVVVPETINLHRLHELIQDVMGWEDCHLYEFECNGRHYGEPDDLSIIIFLGVFNQSFQTDVLCHLKSMRLQ